MKTQMNLREQLPGIRRVVIKVGSRVLIQSSGRPDIRRMRALAKEIAALHHAGKEVVVVSSGAIGAGLHALGRRTRPDNLPDLQMAAAVGQTRLMSRYSALFARESCRIGQVLLTHDDLRDRVRHLNARNTMMNLIRHRIIPVVNENDVVAVDEIKFGDNDHLASLVGMLIDADLLILLSTVDGFRRPAAKGRTLRVPHLPDITDESLALAVGKGSLFSIGGMRTKLESAREFVQLGRLAVIANGRKAGVVGRIMAGAEEGTLIGRGLAPRTVCGSRKRWIAFFNKPQGVLMIDDGACRAIVGQGRSLLPAGVQAVEGRFPMGAVVNVRSLAGETVARGLTEYSSDDLAVIKGRKTAEIAALLGSKDYDEVIHRDHMLILNPVDAGVGAG
jgi:glutamate 5-kinase